MFLKKQLIPNTSYKASITLVIKKKFVLSHIVSNIFVNLVLLYITIKKVYNWICVVNHGIKTDTFLILYIMFLLIFVNELRKFITSIYPKNKNFMGGRKIKEYIIFVYNNVINSSGQRLYGSWKINQWKVFHQYHIWQLS